MIRSLFYSYEDVRESTKGREKFHLSMFELKINTADRSTAILTGKSPKISLGNFVVE